MIATTAVTDRELPLLLLQQLIPGNGYNNLPIAIRIPGRFRWWPLHEAIRTLISREPSLRTVYSSDAGSFRKRTLAADDAKLEIDFVAAAGPDLPDRLAAFAAAPFALDGELLIRVRVFQGADGNTLCLVVHHLVFDAASGYTLLNDLVALYNHLCWHAEPPTQLARPEPVLPERPASTASKKYWREHLAGADPDAAKIRCGRPDPTDPTLAGAVLDHPLPAAAYDAVRELRRELRATESVVFMAAFYALLARHGAGGDLVVGVPLDVRTAGHKRSIGYHVNTVAMRVRVDQDRGFADLVRSVRDSYLTGLAHADASVDDIAVGDRSGSAGSGRGNWRTHPFRYLFNYLPLRIGEDLRVDGEPAEPVYVFNGYSRFDIECFVLVRPDRAIMRLIRSTEIHDETEMRALAERYVALLCAAGAAPDAPTGALAIATDRDRRLTAPPAGSTAVPAGSLLEVIAARVRDTPDAPAVRGPGGVRYQQLWTWAAEIADAIRSRDPGTGAAVALLPCDVDTRAAAILGTWRAGATHLPLVAPNGTTLRAAASAGARLVLAPAPIEPTGADLDILLVPGCPPPGPVSAPPALPPHSSAVLTCPPDGPAVAISHQDLHATVRELAARLGVGAGDAVAATSAPRVDATIVELLVPLTVGGCAVRLAVNAGTDALLDTLVEQDIRAAYLDAATAGSIAQREHGQVRGRVLLCGGPAFPAEVLDRLTEAGATAHRGYAHPRTGRWLTAGRVPAGTVAPGWIGPPLPGAAVAITDEQGRPLPPGLYGRLRAGDGAGAPAVPTGDTARLAWDGAIELVGIDVGTAPAGSTANNPVLSVRADAELLAKVLWLWRQLLDEPGLDEDADFFTNGGQSLLAARLLQRVRRLVGFRIPLDVLISASTPRTFTERLLALRAGAERQPDPKPNGTRR